MHESKSGKQYNTTTFSYNTHIVRVYHFHILKFAFAYLYLYIFVWYVFFWKWKQLFMFIDVAGNMLLCVQCGRGRDSLGWPRPVYRSILVLRQQGKGGEGGEWWIFFNLDKYILHLEKYFLQLRHLAPNLIPQSILIYARKGGVVSDGLRDQESIYRPSLPHPVYICETR